MTPHQSHYYQNNQSPHESGQPSPNSFLTVPPKSRFVFHVQCNLAHLNRTAPELIENGQWKNLLDSAFRHAFDWLGFGAKTTVGYGAMQENPAAQKAREEKAAAVRAEAQRLADAAHRESMSSEDKAWADNEPVIATFRTQFETAKKTPYKPGCQFDGQRVAFMSLVETWVDPKSRQKAGEALKETANKGWGMPSNKDSKKRIQDLVAALCPSQP
jgi:CRISPR-associated protein Cmr6